MNISSFISGHGHVVPRRGGGKGRCKGPNHCADCAADAALVTIKQLWKVEKIFSEPALGSLAAVTVLDHRGVRAYFTEANGGVWLFEDRDRGTSPALASNHSETFTIFEAMEKKGFKWQTTMTSGVSFTHNMGVKAGRGYRPGTKPLDVCLAALEAVGIKLD